MSKNVKIILIVVGIFVFLAAACVGGVGLTSYFFVDRAGIEQSRNEGAEFGKTTDNLGCQTKALSMAEKIRLVDMNEILKTQFFFDGCLKASRPTPNFCDGVPSDSVDIFNDDKGKEAECRKLGVKDSAVCRQVMKEKLVFCEQKQ